MTSRIRRMTDHLLRIVCVTGVVFASACAWAQTYPSRQVTVVVPFSPGNGLDVLARQLTESLRQQMSATMIVDNRPGAAGAIGAALVGRAPSDGYTLLFTANPPFVTAPFALDKVSYDPRTSFTPIARVAVGPLMLVTSSTSGVTSFEELLAYAKANPQKASYASAGPGSPGHLYGEMLSQGFGLHLLQVPYGAPDHALIDVVSGTVLVSFVSVAAATPHIEAGRLRALAVGTRERMARYPAIPTLAELFHRPELEAAVWYGLFGPRGLPKEIVDKLYREVAAAISEPRLAEALGRLSLLPQLQDSQTFAKSLEDDVLFARKMVERAREQN